LSRRPRRLTQIIIPFFARLKEIILKIYCYPAKIQQPKVEIKAFFKIILLKINIITIYIFIKEKCK
jgi:hypothetical protein